MNLEETATHLVIWPVFAVATYWLLNAGWILLFTNLR